MRNISFALTTQQFLDGTKTVTRRLGWQNLRPGDRLMACEKCMGLKKGEQVTKLGEIRVLGVDREPLKRIVDYGQIECEREGFPGLSPQQFMAMFANRMKCTGDTWVTRIRFERVKDTETR